MCKGSIFGPFLEGLLSISPDFFVDDAIHHNLPQSTRALRDDTAHRRPRSAGTAADPEGKSGTCGCYGQPTWLFECHTATATATRQGRTYLHRLGLSLAPSRQRMLMHDDNGGVVRDRLVVGHRPECGARHLALLRLLLLHAAFLAVLVAAVQAAALAACWHHLAPSVALPHQVLALGTTGFCVSVTLAVAAVAAADKRRPVSRCWWTVATLWWRSRGCQSAAAPVVALPLLRRWRASLVRLRSSTWWCNPGVAAVGGKGLPASGFGRGGFTGGGGEGCDGLIRASSEVLSLVVSRAIGVVHKRNVAPAAVGV